MKHRRRPEYSLTAELLNTLPSSQQGKRHQCTLVLLLAACCWALCPTGAPSQTLEQIIQLHLDATGGNERLQAIRSLLILGHMTAFPNYDGPFRSELRRPNSVRVESTFRGKKLIHCFDGQDGWTEIPTAEGETPFTLIQTFAPADLQEMREYIEDGGSPLINYREKGYRLELLGQETVLGIQTYKIGLTRLSGDTDNLYMDVDSFLLVRTEKNRRIRGKSIESTYDLQDYRRVDGIMFPFFHRGILPDGIHQAITVSEVRVNTNVRVCQNPKPQVSATSKKDIVTPRIRSLPAKFSPLDEEVKVAVYFDPNLDIGDPEWVYRHPIRVAFEKPFIRHIYATVCAFFPRCYRASKPDPSESFDLLLRPTYTGRALVRYSLDKSATGSRASPAGGHVALSLAGDIEISARHGEAIDLVRADYTASPKRPMVWSEQSSAKAKAETALTETLQSLAEKIAGSRSLRSYLEQLAEQRARPSDLEATVTFDDSEGLLPNGRLDAGEEARVQVALSNRGPGPAYGIKVRLSAESHYVTAPDPIEIGDLDPGERIDVSFIVRAKIDLPQERLDLRVNVEEKRGYNAQPVRLRISGDKLSKPRLEIIDVVLDDTSPPSYGDGDGQPATGETIQAIVRIRNTGVGDAGRVALELSSPLADVQLIEPHAYLRVIPVNQIREARFLLRIPPTVDSAILELQFSAVENRGHKVARVDLVRQWPIRAKRPRIEVSYRFFDGNSPNSTGNSDGHASNNEQIEFALVTSNRGQLDAREVSLSVESLSPKIEIGSALLKIGDIPAGTEAPEQRFTLSIPRWFTHDDVPKKLRLRTKISQQDFPTSQDEIVVAFRPMRPVLKAAVGVLPQLAVGDTGELVIRVRNEGDLKAEDVRVKLSTDVKGLAFLDENDVPIRSATFALGPLRETAVSQNVRVKVQARRSLTPGEAPIELAISERDFGSVNETLYLNITGEEELVVSAVPDVRPPAGVVAIPIPPVVAFLRPERGAHVTVKRQTIPFKVQYLGELVELRLTHNRKAIPLGAPIEGTAPSPDPAIMAVERYDVSVELTPGPNHFEITAISNTSESKATFSLTYDTDGGTIWVVAIGISDYSDPKVPDLKYADADARKLHDYYRTNLALPANQVILLTDQNATLKEMRSLLGTRLARLSTHADDTVIIYFAGHGIRKNDGASRSEDGFSKYLLPFDADPDDPYATALRSEELILISRMLQSQRVVFILDSCFSGSALGGRTLADPYGANRAAIDDSFLVDVVQAGSGRVILTASRANEVARELPDLGHGVFTYHLLRGLRGAADRNTDGNIDASELYAYVEDKVLESTEGNQHPGFKGDLDGQIIVGRSSIRSTPLE